ncbi:MAG: ATP-binding protein [Bacteroidales bacterium]|nr:ATP-binding protein [Bacteroidales bacterium]
MDKSLLKQILLDNQREVECHVVIPREIDIDQFNCYVLVGVRRSGKSYMLYHKMQRLLASGVDWSNMLYLNFEDERLVGFQTEDFNLILECHAEMYGKKPMLFLDEVQNVEMWHKFARRMADSGYSVYLTGSNSKMLSGEVNTTLGGRFIAKEVYPFSFKECLDAKGIAHGELEMMGTESRAAIVREFNDYFLHGGLPASINLPAKQDYITSVYQKIYLGDIIARNKITNALGMRVMLKKMAETVCRPISFNRIQHILSSVGGKLSLASVIKYVDYCEQAWLLLRLKNIKAVLAEKESNCKYYFIDNGVLNLFLFDKESMLLENAVALQLFRKFGHDSEADTVFFYNDGNVEVDFYVPEQSLAIQVSYSISQATEAGRATYEREVGALSKLPKVLDCQRRVIVTFEEEGRIDDRYGDIEVIPFWKWALID